MTTGQKAIIAALAGLYATLRFWGLTDSCLWFDEIFGVHAAEHTWGGMLWFAAQDLIHPPLFYALLKLWISVGGDSLMWLRLFPVVFAVLAIFPFLQICRELGLGWKAMALALLLFSVNGALIKYAQEVRMYSLLLFISLMSIWLFSRFFIKGKSFAALVVVNILLVYTHYFGWLVVGSELAAILVFQRIKLRQALIMIAVAAMAFVPWAVAAYRAAKAGSDIGQNIGWIKKPDLAAVFDLIFDVVEPFYYQASSADPISLLYISVPMLILIGTAKVIYFAEWKTAEGKEAFAMFSLFAGLPIAAALAASWLLPYSVWGSRHLIIVFAPLLILSAVFITGLPKKQMTMAAVGFLLLLTAVAFVVKTGEDRRYYTWCTWEQAAEKLSNSRGITAESQPIRVYAFEDLSAYHLWFALRKDQNYSVFKVEGIDALAEDKAFFLPRGFNGVGRVTPEEIEDKKLWLVFRATSHEKTLEPLSSFSKRGYDLNDPIVFISEGTNTFLVFGEKDYETAR